MSLLHCFIAFLVYDSISFDKKAQKIFRKLQFWKTFQEDAARKALMKEYKTKCKKLK